MTFQPFAVYDFRSGLNLATDPWKTPADAFNILSNFMLRRGILRKRAGQSVYGQLGKYVAAEGIINGTIQYFDHTCVNTPVIPGSVSVSNGCVATPYTIYDDGEGGFIGDVAGAGTIDYESGVITSAGFTTLEALCTVTINYNYEIDEDTRGVYQFDRYTGSNLLVGFQDTRMSKWDTTHQYFQNITAQGGVNYDLWNSTNLVWTWPYNDKLWITDNTVYDATGAFPINGIRYYDGSVIRDPIADDTSLKYGAVATDLIKSALIIFSHKERIVMLNVVEGAGSEHKPQRATWSWAGNPLNADAWRRDTPGKGGYVDAPTNDEIVSFSFFGEIPIVGFEHSIWALDYIGDPNLPFTWRRIAGFKDVSSTYSGIEYVSSAAFLGGKGLIATNGSSCDNFDKIIPDFIYDVDIDNIDKCYAGRNDCLDQIWLAYPRAPNTASNNAVLVYNYEDMAFSKYDLPCFCFGSWVESTDKTFADYSGHTIESLAGVMWGDRSMQAGYPILLSGGTHGYVYDCNDDESNVDVTDWLGTESIIDFEIMTGRLNPFIQQGSEVLLQQVGFFVTKLTNAQFTVDLYVDEDIEPVYTATIDCSTGEGDKMWVFADMVATGEFIRMKMYLSDAQKADTNIPLQQLEIHGMIFWMKPGAKIKQ